MERYAASGISALAFCLAESISLQRFYRWRRRLRGPESVRLQAIAAVSDAGFVDLGALGARAPAPRMDFTPALGGGLRLHLAKG